MKHKKLFTAITGLIGMSIFGIQTVQAGDILTVDSTSDTTQPGLTTLREAIDASNQSSDSIIEFDSSVFSSPQKITLKQGELLITSNVTIKGPGKDLLTIDGDASSRIFKVNDDSNTIQTVEINDLTLTNGLVQGRSRGGCVSSFEALTIKDSVITSCASEGRGGGGVFSGNGALNILNSTVSDNYAVNDGGGLYAEDAEVLIAGSTISGNTAGDNGGGIFLEAYSNTEIINSTISNNVSIPIRVGGIRLEVVTASLTANNMSVVNNTGAGLTSRRASLINVSNSLFVGNSNRECNFILINPGSQNINNLDTDGSCDRLATNHLTVADPLLGQLANNGGSTLTHAPLVGSPAIDAGDDSLCVGLDQRGVKRPQDGDDDGSVLCDIGAVEFIFESDELIFSNGFDFL